MTSRLLAATAITALLTLTSCGGQATSASSQPEATVTVTVTVTAYPDEFHNEDEELGEAPAPPAEAGTVAFGGLLHKSWTRAA